MKLIVILGSYVFEYHTQIDNLIDYNKVNNKTD